MVHVSAFHSVTAKYLNLELSTGNFSGLRMGVCSTATTAVKLDRRATRRVWAGRRARPRRVRRVHAVTGVRPGLAPVRRGAAGRA